MVISKRELSEAPSPATSLDLRIEQIRATPVNIPLVAPYRWAAGTYGGATKVIVEVETKAGILGLGEAPHWRHAQLITEEIAPRLIGFSAYDLRLCRSRVIPPLETLRNTDVPDIVRAYAGIEIAFWDIRAKMVGVPLYQLLGGPARKEIPFTEYFSAREASNGHGGEEAPQDIADLCARMIVEHDSPFFEGKVGYSDLATDVAIAREVRQAIGPDRMLRLDANMGWRLNTAREALAQLAEYEISNIEDPVVHFEDMAALRRHSSIPFSTHTPDLRRASDLGVPDTIVLNLTALGGIEPTLRFVAACAEVGVGFWFYSGDAGIATSGYLHLAAADPYLDQPSQSLLRWYADDVIEGGPFSPERGVVQVPEGPGLGVTLDRAGFRRCHTRFLDMGPIDQFGVTGETGVYRHVPAY